jgi:predicted RNA-binding protein with TRAM domain
LNPTGDGGEATVHLRVGEAQFLLVTAVKGDAAAADPTLAVGVGGNDPERIAWEGEPGEALRVARLELQGRPTEIVVGRMGGASDEQTQVRTFSANRSLRSLETRLDTAVTRLREILEGAGIEADPVRLGTRRRVTLDENPDNGAGMAGIVITPERPGYYLFTVAGNNGEDVDLAVSQTTTSASEEQARDDSYSSWAAVVVQVDDAKGVTLNGAIVAPKSGIQCTLDVYFVPLAATPAT